MGIMDIMANVGDGLVRNNSFKGDASQQFANTTAAWEKVNQMQRQNRLANLDQDRQRGADDAFNSATSQIMQNMINSGRNGQQQISLYDAQKSMMQNLVNDPSFKQMAPAVQMRIMSQMGRENQAELQRQFKGGNINGIEGRAYAVGAASPATSFQEALHKKTPEALIAEFQKQGMNYSYDNAKGEMVMPDGDRIPMSRVRAELQAFDPEGSMHRLSMSNLAKKEEMAKISRQYAIMAAMAQDENTRKMLLGMVENPDNPQSQQLQELFYQTMQNQGQGQEQGQETNFNPQNVRPVSNEDINQMVPANPYSAAYGEDPMPQLQSPFLTKPLDTAGKMPGQLTKDNVSAIMDAVMKATTDQQKKRADRKKQYEDAQARRK